MIRGRSIAALVVAVMTAGLLAACVQPTASPSPTGPSAAAASSPTPEPTQPTTPGARPPLGCEDLATDSEVAAAFGEAAIPAPVGADQKGGSLGNIQQLSSVSLLQAGGIACGWALGGGASLFTARFLPDARSSWTTGVPGRFDIPSVTGWADKAAFGCVKADGEYCVTEALVGSVWVETIAYGALDALVAGIETLDKEVIAAVRSAGVPGPPWTAPPHPTFTCSELIAEGSGIAGISDLKLDSTAPDYAPDPMTSTALAQVGGVGCVWHSTQGAVWLVYLPGGAWSWVSHPMSWGESPTVPSLPGVADQAAGACFSDEECGVQAISGSTRIGLLVNPFGGTITLDSTARALRDILTRIG